MTSAYGGYSSCRQYLDDIAAAQAKVGPRAPRVEKLRLYYNHPGWVGRGRPTSPSALEACNVSRPLAEPVRTAPMPPSPPVGTGAVEVLFSAHSIPVALARNSPYVDHVTEAARLAAEGARVKSWQLVWQSRSGSPSSPWLGPDVCDVVRASSAGDIRRGPDRLRLRQHGGRLRPRYRGRRCSQGKGGRFVRAATVSTTPAFVSMVRELVARARGTLRAAARRGHVRAMARQLPGRPLPRQRSHGK